MEQVSEWAQLRALKHRYYAPIEEVLHGVDNVLLISSFEDPHAESLGVDTWTASAGKPEQLIESLTDWWPRVTAQSSPLLSPRLQSGCRRTSHRRACR